MVALAAERSTLAFDSPNRGPHPPLKMKANVKIFKGSLVVLDAGFVKPAVAAGSLAAVGRAEETKDNTGGANGDVEIEIFAGVFAWENKGGDLLTEADVGLVASIEDDQTVRKTAAGTSAAGTVERVDTSPARVWVRTDFPVVSL